ncbi:tetratricopeptide repeat protein [Flavobacterium eburneipallidum]|uniref:type IX secretion system periplasmic lipoprotein PorW/SprE n=1 Tax=Flavobacterium eburneipallidum TaxID=3003263 RepID=UPI002482F196|nr:tetratricopeptide repeat protein [Flavobacterium eburneipallidum]
MKTKILKLTFFIAFLILLIACSTKKDTFLARNSHALSTRDNILYNGQIGMDKGIKDVNANIKENFWKRLPVERMEIVDDNGAAKPKNANFELAEAKATKAIQKHSMNIGGQEKNYQIDEAYLLLGKARYYDQRFIPALDAFNYILYKYPSSDKIYQAKIWREKANMRLGNDAQVIKNISKLLEDKKEADKFKKAKNFKKQVVADANALLAQSFLNMEEKDSAVAKLKIAEKLTKVNSERARYRFILGQLYQELGKKDSAIYSYESVIDMNRKADRRYVIQAYAKKSELFDYQNDDKEAFVKTFNKLIADRENRPFLDVIYYEMGVFYDKQDNQELAMEFYNASLKAKSQDSYLVASDYRNLGDMHFRNTDYAIAAKYYDSTLVKMEPKTREYIHIKKVRKDLDEVIEYEAVAKENDSILRLVALSPTDRILYFEKHIEKLKKSDEAKRILEEKQQQKLANVDLNNINSSDDPIPNTPGTPAKKSSMTPPSMSNASSTSSVFYFYNPTTVAFGKTEFKKKWGNRTLGGNWRLSTNKNTDTNDIASDTTATAKPGEVKEVEQYTTAFYLDQIPKEQTEIDEIVKKRDFAYYQLGLIYKEKFKEYQLASQKLEQLLANKPEEKLVLPSMYNLYKIYQIINPAKAEEMKARISSQYPDSRYAQIINNTNAVASKDAPEDVYDQYYKVYEDEQFDGLLAKLDGLILQYSGDEIVPKFELLKANLLGKLKGVEAYKNAMQYVADNYPTSDEGKKAVEILTDQIPSLEKINFSTAESKNWKILFSVGKIDDKKTKELEEKIKKFIANENYQRLTYSYDFYTEKESFITIHGLKSESNAAYMINLMRNDKKYKIIDPLIVISSENYKVVQIKKNLDVYLNSPKPVAVPVQTTAPSTVVPPATKSVAPAGMMPPAPKPSSPPKQ